MELQIFSVALIVQRRAGGNLAELMNKLATLIRNRYRLHAKVKSLTGEGRMQAVVLTALPPLTLLAMCVVNREYAQELFDHPHLLYIAGASQVVGIACIRWIVRSPL
jgi:tight adherence protein B